MEIHVDLVPNGSDSASRSDRASVVLVVDVIRSATTAAVLLDRGVPSLTLTAALRAARAVAAEQGAWLVGERDGMPPEGFNFGNSPVTLRSADLKGRPAVLLAAESPRALTALERPELAGGRPHVALVGLNNALAAAREVATMEPEHLKVVCAGIGGAPDLADVVCAGLLVSLVARHARREASVRLDGSARFCLSVLRTTSDPLDGLWVSLGGSDLRSAGFDEDVAVASAVGTTDTVPWVHGVAEVAGRQVVHVLPTRPS